MKFALIKNGVVEQVQPYEEEGFISCPDWVIPGYMYDSGAFLDFQIEKGATGDASSDGKDPVVDGSGKVKYFKVAKEHIPVKATTKAEIGLCCGKKVSISSKDIKDCTCKYLKKVGKEIVFPWKS